MLISSPFSQAENTVSQPPAFEAPDKTGPKSSDFILVVDDDATGRKPLLRILSGAGRSCTPGPDGIEALAALHKKPPSLLLLDFDAPGMAAVARRRSN